MTAMTENPIKFESRRPVYFVRTDPKNPRHHGIHTTQSSHLLTLRPGRGDVIEYVLELGVRLTYSPETRQWLPTSFGLVRNLELDDGTKPRFGFLRVRGAPSWRGLGDDSDGPGEEDILGDVLAEALGSPGWTYAAVEPEWISRADWHGPTQIHGECDESGFWRVTETSETERGNTRDLAAHREVLREPAGGVVVLPPAEFDRLVELTHNPPEPSQSLRDAAAEHDRRIKGKE